MAQNIIDPSYNDFLEELKKRVESSKYRAAIKVNQELVLLYHHIGTQILKSQEEKGWGSKVIEQLGKDLKAAFPEMRGFSPTNLRNMRRFAELYPGGQIHQPLAGELPWHHHVILMEKTNSAEERSFYLKAAVEYGWSRRAMVHQIETDLYHRQGKAVTNFKDKLPLSQSELANRILKDPYDFDFLGLGKDAYEREVENELIRHMEKFLIELGAGFAFVGRQYHLEVSKHDFYIDLLFYHLKLRSFVVIELKDKEFKPEYAGKMNFYLSAVDDLVKHPSDQPSIGLILCKTKDNVLAEYALRDMTKPIGLAEYRLTDALPKEIKTNLPSIEELEKELSKDLISRDSNG